MPPKTLVAAASRKGCSVVARPCAALPSGSIDAGIRRRLTPDRTIPPEAESWDGGLPPAGAGTDMNPAPTVLSTLTASLGADLSPTAAPDDNGFFSGAANAAS